MSTIDEILPDLRAAEPDLPRRQTGAAQYLTVTLLADYGLRGAVWWPSAGIVGLLAEFGVSEVAARATLSRLARRGVLEQGKSGRRTSYRLTEQAAAALAIGGQRVASFAEEAQTWDGQWTLVAFSLGGDSGDARRLRARLRWLGYAAAYDGLWVSPRADPDFTATSLCDLTVAARTIFRAQEHRSVLPANRSPLDAWDLTRIAEEYQRFLRGCSRLGALDGRAALTARTRLMDEYRRFPALDPQLPQELMPRGWLRGRARSQFEDRYDRLGPASEMRVRQVLTDAGVAVPDGLARHTVAELRAGAFLRPRPFADVVNAPEA